MEHKYISCKKALSNMKQYGHCEVIDKKEIPKGLQWDCTMEDAIPDGLEVEDWIILPKLDMFEGIHRMGPSKLKCLIHKLQKADKEAYKSYCLLKNFRHPAVVTLQNFYDETGQARIVLSWLDGRFDDLVRCKGGRKTFFKKTPNGLDLSEFFRHFMIDISAGLEALFEQNLYPQNICIDDLYVYKGGSSEQRVKILVFIVDQIDSPLDSEARKVKLWDDVRDIAYQIKRVTDNTIARASAKQNRSKVSAVKAPALSKVAERFIEYVGNAASKLAQYPDDWTYQQKGDYLLLVIAADESKTWKRLQQGGGLEWPWDQRTGNIPDLLLRLVANDNKRPKPFGYNAANPYHYLVLCRTVYKHFWSLRNQVKSLKDLCLKPEDFLKIMEKWKPEIWCIIYDAVSKKKNVAVGGTDAS